MKNYRMIGGMMAALALSGCNYFGDKQFKQTAVDLGDLGRMNNLIKYKDGKGFYICRDGDELKVTDLPQEFFNSTDVKLKRKTFYDLDLCEND